MLTNKCSTFLRYSLLLPLVALPRFCFSQTPTDEPIRDVEVCQILSNAEAFDGKTVRFRGRLEFEFEGHAVDDSVCRLPFIHTGIWWTYGGEPLLARQPGMKKVQAMTSPVLQDAQFDEFRERIRAYRRKRPDGEACRSHRECAYYDVVATYTGKFFAGKKMPGRTIAGGFGHFGCCHLFVVEQVSEVEARRTSVPDDAQKFSCADSTWKSEYPAASFPSIEKRSAANKQFLADLLHVQGDDSLLETMVPYPSWYHLGISGYLSWSSPDLLTTYTAHYPQALQPKKVNDQPSAPILMNVTREHCEPAVN